VLFVPARWHWCRAKITALVRDKAAAQLAFGSYIDSVVAGDTQSAGALRASLRNACAVICCGLLGELAAVLPRSRVQHVVLLSSAGIYAS
jgi:hypothetical protein